MCGGGDAAINIPIVRSEIKRPRSAYGRKSVGPSDRWALEKVRRGVESELSFTVAPMSLHINARGIQELIFVRDRQSGPDITLPRTSLRAYNSFLFFSISFYTYRLSARPPSRAYFGEFASLNREHTHTNTLFPRSIRYALLSVYTEKILSRQKYYRILVRFS